MRLAERIRKPAFWVSMGCILGCGAITIVVEEALLHGGRRLTLDSTLALFAGLLIAYLGLLTAAGAMFNVKQPDARTRGLIASASIVLCAALLLVPVFMPESLDRRATLGIFAALLVLSMTINWAYRRRADEMQRRMMTDASAAGYGVFQAAILLFAAAQTLNIDLGFGLWGLIAVLILLQTVISVSVGLRRHAPYPTD